MVAPQRATIANEIIKELNLLRRQGWLDMVSAQRLLKKAAPLKQLDPEVFHSIEGMIACLRRDLDGMRARFDEGWRKGATTFPLEQKAVSLTHWWLFDEACDVLDVALKSFRAEPEILRKACEFAMWGGQLDRARSYYAELVKLRSECLADTQLAQLPKISTFAAKHGMDSATLSALLSQVATIVRERPDFTLTSHPYIELFMDPMESAQQLHYEIRFYGSHESAAALEHDIFRFLVDAESEIEQRGLIAFSVYPSSFTEEGATA